MKARVIANGVRLYESNYAGSAAKGFARIGDELDIEAEFGDWCKLADGRWVEACYMEALELGGGGAASDNIIFSTDEFLYGSVTCNKTFDEITSLLQNKQTDVKFFLEVDGFVAGAFFPHAWAFEDATVIFMFSIGVLFLQVVCTPDGITQVVNGEA